MILTHQTDHTTQTHLLHHYHHHQTLTISLQNPFAAGAWWRIHLNHHHHHLYSVMLAGVISSRPKHWLLGSSPITHYALSSRHRQIHSDASFPIKLICPYNSGLNFDVSAASVWHAILPAGNSHGKHNLLPPGEGSWNVAWDVRPARWLHRPYTAWLLFGICACLAAPPVEVNDSGTEVLIADDDKINGGCIATVSENSINYRITGLWIVITCCSIFCFHCLCGWVYEIWFYVWFWLFCGIYEILFYAVWFGYRM